jgi:hypothetical protein
MLQQQALPVWRMLQVRSAGKHVAASMSKRQAEAVVDLEGSLAKSTAACDELRLTAARVPGLQKRIAAYEAKADETSKRHEVCCCCAHVLSLLCVL